MEKIEVRLNEVREVFEFLEELHDFMHQPENFLNTEQITQFIESGNYQKLKHVYYHVVWDWLPTAIQKEYENKEK